VHAAHELCDETGTPLNVIHRDVSPQNILLTPEGHVKVADFGIAKARDQLQQATARGAVKGKIAYMAPEQFLCKAIDRRVDVFALGCVLYGITVGDKPFAGDGVATIYRILEGCFEHPSKVAQDYPSELEAIVLRAMATDPDERYGTAEEMRLALEGWIAASGSHLTEDAVREVLGASLGPRIEARAAQIRESQAQLEMAPVDGRTADARVTESVIPVFVHYEVPDATHETCDVPGRLVPRSSFRRNLVLGGAVLLAMFAAAALAVATKPASVAHTSGGAAVETAPSALSRASEPARAPGASVSVAARATPRTPQPLVDDGPPQALRHRSVVASDNGDERSRTTRSDRPLPPESGLAPQAARGKVASPKAGPQAASTTTSPVEVARRPSEERDLPVPGMAAAKPPRQLDRDYPP
jgi:serine/threonine-protein kinase